MLLAILAAVLFLGVGNTYVNTPFPTYPLK